MANDSQLITRRSEVQILPPQPRRRKHQIACDDDFLSEESPSRAHSAIAFVPFAIVGLPLAGEERLTVPLVALQTAAANPGSMLTPKGNP